MNLRDCATQLAREQTSNNSIKSLHQKTLLIVGSKNVGKTTLINRFLDRNEPSKKTLALEYTFARKTGSHSLMKDVCHVWELGGGALFTPVLEQVSLVDCGCLSVVLMIDLSDLSNLWLCLEALLNSIRNSLKSKQTLNEAVQTIIRQHPDKDIMEPFPAPLVILGGKYDLFQEFEPEKKKVVCRCLRYVAHTLCGSLVFYSCKDPSQAKRAKDLLNHLAFGSPPLKTVCTDYNKALSIPCGSDSVESIEGIGASTKWTLDKIRHVFTTHFVQDESKMAATVVDDPANDTNFREPLVDSLRRQKDEELDRYCQEMERREKRGL